jgi:hypothetical protein
VSYLILGNSRELWINLLSAKRTRNLERMIIIEAMVKSEYGHRQEREFLESKVEVKGYWQWVKAWAIAIGNDKEHWQIGEWVVESWQMTVRLEARTRAIGQHWEESRERGKERDQRGQEVQERLSHGFFGSRLHVTKEMINRRELAIVFTAVERGWVGRG